MTLLDEGRWPFPPVTFAIEPHCTALLVIDMQYYDAHPDYGIGKAIEMALPGAGGYFFKRLREETIPNIQRLLGFFREQGLLVLYTAMGSNFRDGRDLAPLARAKYAQREGYAGCAIPCYRGHFEYSILADLQPNPYELIIHKTTPGAFASTNLDQLLRNTGMEALIVTGVVTDACVDSTARTAADLGYKCVLVSDACAAHEAAAHAATLHSFSKYSGRVATTEEVINQLYAGMNPFHARVL
ncbi:MAG: cysteine hydrolase [Verrucomicrobia bacterium]|nr:cysteine hydrolase [Verrucomicrobiota bacterium]